MHRRLRRLYRIVLIVDWRGGAGEIVDFVDFNVQREGDIVPDEFEARMIVQVLDIALAAGEEVVGAQDLMALLQQTVAQVRAQETGAARDQYSLADVIGAHFSTQFRILRCRRLPDPASGARSCHETNVYNQMTSPAQLPGLFFGTSILIQSQ
jgi:hypothetical protein